MKRFYAFFLAGLLSFNLFAQDEDLDMGNAKIKLSGFGYYMFGQIVHGIYGDSWESATSSFDHLWVNTSLLHLNIESNATDWFTTKLGLEFYVTFPLQGSNAMDKASYFRTYKSYLAEAAGIMHWDLDNPQIPFLFGINIPTFLSSLKIRTGMLPYTINPEVKTLGNYLYRSTIHPVSIQNKVDYPWADLLGGVAEAGFVENKLRIEAMLSSEFNYVPFFDFTPAFGVYVKPNEIIDIGGAIAFHHALQANCALMPDSVGKDWQGTKIDARAIFDPKPIFGGMDFLGDEEFKIYAELAVLGLKDTLEVDTSNLSSLRSKDTTALKNLVFPKYSILNRIPLMIGFNVPTWKMLDLLSVELEWFYSPYANHWLGLFDQQSTYSPQPGFLKQWDNYINKDNFKWAIHLKKSVGKFEVKGLVSSDHTIYVINNVTNGNFEQTMKRPGDWQWLVQLRYNL